MPVSFSVTPFCDFPAIFSYEDTSRYQRTDGTLAVSCSLGPVYDLVISCPFLYETGEDYDQIFAVSALFFLFLEFKSLEG